MQYKRNAESLAAVHTHTHTHTHNTFYKTRKTRQLPIKQKKKLA